MVANKRQISNQLIVVCLAQRLLLLVSLIINQPVDYLEVRHLLTPYLSLLRILEVYLVFLAISLLRVLEAFLALLITNPLKVHKVYLVLPKVRQDLDHQAQIHQTISLEALEVPKINHLALFSVFLKPNLMTNLNHLALFLVLPAQLTSHRLQPKTSPHQIPHHLQAYSARSPKTSQLIRRKNLSRRSAEEEEATLGLSLA
mmetsp:Transcript_9260/g.6614  ORF Transcript_9260/g.6614 Transcript_9260/m.6614 type:complete len:201 (+) Transcript_9260:203-805(+)